MRLNLKTPPSAEPVSLEEAKGHLRVDTAEDNALITGLITVARENVERFLQRALITQTWEMVLDEAEAEIRIPLPPLQAVTKIEVIAADGTKTEVSSLLYDVEFSQGRPGRVRLKSGCVWPTHRGFASFIITFRAGYGDGSTAVPAPIREAIKQWLALVYENRGDAMERTFKAEDEMPTLAKTLLWPYRVISL